MQPLGHHVIADLSGLADTLLRDVDAVTNTLERALLAERFTILDRSRHVFPGPGGFTAFFLLSESHAAIHTYPEHGYLALDVFGCGDGDARAVIDEVVRQLGATDVRVTQIARSARSPLRV